MKRKQEYARVVTRLFVLIMPFMLHNLHVLYTIKVRYGISLVSDLAELGRKNDYSYGAGEGLISLQKKGKWISHKTVVLSDDCHPPSISGKSATGGKDILEHRLEIAQDKGVRLLQLLTNIVPGL